MGAAAGVAALTMSGLNGPQASAQTGPYVNTSTGTYGGTCNITQGNTNAGDLRVPVTVSDSFTIDDVDVGFIVEHTFRLDTEAWLTSPSGTRVQLLTGPAINLQVDNYNVRFDQDAAIEVNTGTASGDHSLTVGFPQFTVTPAAGATGSLSDFDGEQANGTWFVDFCDNFALDDGTVSRVELFFAAAAPPTDADVSLAIAAANSSPSEGTQTFFDVTVSNAGGLDTSGVTVDVTLPAGLVYTSDNSGGEYNPTSGVWTVPGTLAAGTSDTIRIFAIVQFSGPYTVNAEVATSVQSDPDSTPGNGSSTEDDDATFTFTPVAPPVPIICLGRPIVPLVFQNPVAESAGADPGNPSVNDVFRFPEVVPGADALVRVSAFNNGASLLTIDDDANGFNENFQPTLLAPNAGEASVDLEITIVATGDTTPATIDFAGSTVDVDGGAGIREYVEVSDNIVESAIDQNSALGINASGPSAADRVRFEVLTETQAPNGAISEDAGHIAVAFFTDVSVFEYRIGKFGNALGGAGRLNSLAFDCPTINPTTTNPVADEDFGDAPFDNDPAARPNYGNPIHTIAAGVQLGATNTADLAPGDSPTASTDTGDDGVTMPASFQGLVASNITVSVQGAGYLQGFFDWNNDGDFEDAGEQPIVDVQDTNNDGTITISVTPPGNTVAGTSFARFRWSTANGVGIQDPAGDGEVEDYQITLVEAVNADLSLTMGFSNTVAGVGSPVIITLTVTNDGPAESNAVTVSFPFPANTTFSSDDGSGAFDSSTGIWTLPASILSGGSATLNITLTVDAVGDIDFLSEILTADRPDPDSTPGNSGTTTAEDDTDEGTVTVAAVLAVLTGSKTNALFDPGNTGDVLAIPGNDVVYTITINNTGNGPADANSIELIDLMPSEMAFFNGDADGDTSGGIDVIDFDPGTSTLSFDEATDLAFSFLDPSTPPADFAACGDTIPPPTPENVQSAVNFVCFNPKGAMAAGSTVTISFRARIE